MKSSRITRTFQYLTPFVFVVSILVSIIVALASSVDPNGEVVVLASIVKTLALLPVNILLFGGCECLRSRYLSGTRIEISKYCDKIANGAVVPYFNRRVFVYMAFLLLCWIPYAIMLYPGVVTFDTSFQLCQFFGNEMPGIFPVPDGFAFTDHHPIMVTLLFGSIVSLGKALASYNVGFFLVCLFVAMLTAMAMGVSVRRLEAYGLPRRFALVLLGFFAFFPLFPFMVMTPSKDSLSVPLYLLFTLCVFEIVATHGRRLDDRRFFAILLTVSVLLPLAKKTGVYVLALVLFALFILFNRNRSRLMLTGVVSLAFCLVLVPKVVFPALDVAKGSSVEMLGPLYQQTARYVSEHKDEIDPKNRDAIDKVLGFDSLDDRYNFSIVDTVIHAYDEMNLNPSLNDLLDYLGSYVSLGLRHPGTYLESFIVLEKGWFDTNESMLFAEGDGLQLAPPNGQPDIRRSDIGQKIAAYPRSLMSWLSEVPGIDIFFLPALYTLLLPCACMVLLKGSGSNVILIPTFVSLLFLLLSPVSLVSSNIEALRYLLPFVYTSPLLLAMALLLASLKSKLNA